MEQNDGAETCEPCAHASDILLIGGSKELTADAQTLKTCQTAARLLNLLHSAVQSPVACRQTRQGLLSQPPLVMH